MKPISEANLAGTARTDFADKARLAGLTILVAEDREENREVARFALERLSCSPHFAKDGEEALALFEKESFDALLLDLKMPHMDGFAVAREIRSREKSGKRIPIVATSAYLSEELKQSCAEWGFDAVLDKPFRIEELGRTLKKLFPGVAPLR